MTTSPEAGVRVKICGLRDAETALAVRDLPIDYIGFVFAPSRRRVTAEQAGAVIRAVRGARSASPPPKFVGVFVNPDPDETAEVVRAAPLDGIQLHGTETPEMCRRFREELGVFVWKTVPVEDAAGSLSLREAEKRLGPYEGAVDGVVLDRPSGGSGMTFPWEAIPVYRRWTSSRGIPLIVAGGLHAGNVGELLARHRPDVVDVSSGVETGGVKDPDKIRAFVGRVKLHGTISG